MFTFQHLSQKLCQSGQILPRSLRMMGEWSGLVNETSWRSRGKGGGGIPCHNIICCDHNVIMALFVGQVHSYTSHSLLVLVHALERTLGW